MVSIYQIWGGLFYLLNKVFLNIAERKERSDPNKKETWRVASWVVYILGTPPWIILFIREHNWIAAAFEVGGIPAMVIGLVVAMRGVGKEPKWLHLIALISVVLGLGYSWYYFSGIRTLNQFIEMIMIGAYLVGTYQIAHKKLSGYVWYMIMNLACMALMYPRYPWLVVQQIISIGFVIDAYFVKRSAIKK